jgi:DNA-binding MarR family transcriptional regulator
MTSTLTSSDPPVSEAPDPELEESAEQIAASVISMMRQFNTIKSRVALGHEGDTSPIFLLIKLAHLGPRRASDLAEQLCADPSTVSRQVAHLVKSGLVERKADPDDGRASILVPTELGRVKVREHAQRRGDTMKPVIADWSAQDRGDFLRLMNKYIEGIEAHREQMISIMLEHHGKGAS